MKKKLPEPETINYTLCSCGTELLMVEYEKEEKFEEWYFAMFERGTHYNNKLTFWQRLRWGFQILKTGKPYTDELCLNREKIKDLIKFLQGTLENKKEDL